MSEGVIGGVLVCAMEYQEVLENDRECQNVLGTAMECPGVPRSARE